MAESNSRNPARRTLREDENLLLEYGAALKIGALLLGLFVGWLLLSLLFSDNRGERYLLLRDVHAFVSDAGLVIAGVMLAISVYIGLYRHADVTPWFRGTTYTIFGFMLIQGLIGGVMYLMGGRPGEDVHIIYGYGVVLSLPFFIFVEVTARRRPAMGSYIWGFVLLAAIIVRCMSTGPVV